MRIVAIIVAVAVLSVELVASHNDHQLKHSNHHGDPCTALSKASKYTPSTARACYLNFPYNKTIADDILDAVSNVYSNFYTFLDIAMEKPAKGFTFNPVDILGGLEKIRKTKFKTDFGFNQAIQQLVVGLYDSHAKYWSMCYTAITWQQPIYLYAPIVNKKQSLKVFHTAPGHAPLGKHLVDCDVLEIDGKPGMEVVTQYANSQDQNSKDLGVRLNDVLAGYTLYGTDDFMFWPGLFSKRQFLPERDSVTYTLQCHSEVFNITTPWTGNLSRPYLHFHDSKSYWEANCISTDTAATKTLSTKKHLITEKFPYKENVSAKYLYGGSNSRFYMLDNVTGVAMISTEDIRYKNTYGVTLTGFQMLADAGAKKIILDFVNNGGGSIDYALFIVALLFPDTIATFPQNLRASKLAQDLSRVNCSIWDSQSYVEWSPDPKHQVPVKNNVFIPGVGIKHGGKVSRYSQLVAFGYGWTIKPEKPFPWKGSDIAVFTNGACGSACSLIAAHIKYYNGVRMAAIGGFKDTPLTAISFPGGMVQYFDETFDPCFNVKGVPKPLPINAMFTIPVVEVFHDPKAKTPLEYIPLFADLHIDYTPKNARDPAVAWREVAKTFFK